jgi:hypothetical protein
MSDWHPPPEQQPQQPLYGAPQYGAPPTHPYASNTDKRPGTVTTAVVLTWVGCGLAMIGSLLALALAFSDSDTFMDGFTRGSDGQFTRAQAQGILIGFGVVCFVWSVAASVLALLTLKRQGWARVLLTISAVMAALVSVVLILSVVSAITLVMAIAAVVLLFVGGANDWFAHRSAVPHHGAAPQYYG